MPQGPYWTNARDGVCVHGKCSEVLSDHCRVHAAYGTYVLAATDMTCRVKELEQEVVVFNPKKEVIALVAITWAFQIITLCALTYLHISPSLQYPVHIMGGAYSDCCSIHGVGESMQVCICDQLTGALFLAPVARPSHVPGLFKGSPARSECAASCAGSTSTSCTMHGRTSRAQRRGSSAFCGLGAMCCASVVRP